MDIKDIVEALPESTIQSNKLDTIEKRYNYVIENYDVNIFSILTEDFLKSISYKSCIPQSTHNLTVTQSILNMVLCDVTAYSCKLLSNETLPVFNYRIKAVSSILGKIKRYPNLSFQSIFNDILSIRIKVKDYIKDTPPYLRYVDLRNGKKNDDGYRAQHLYYKLDNHHYTIEIQLWSDHDYNFNSWSHSYAYKHTDNEKLLQVRKMYDSGVIKTPEDFVRCLNG